MTQSKIPYSQYQATGNTFAIINALEEMPIKESELNEFAKKTCDKDTGVGVDGLILILPSEKADYKMRIFNADGSEAEMCGNGIRAFAKYILDKDIDKKIRIDYDRKLSVETLAGIKTIENLDDFMFKVDMGEPILESGKIPAHLKGITKTEKIIDQEYEKNDKKYNITCVSIGNPHCVIFVDEVDNYPVEEEGAPISNDTETFPNRVNVEFIQIITDKEISMRVWERGVGETQACGTGASAAAVACILNKKTGRSVKVHLSGGNLHIDWLEENNHIIMTGPAEEEFEGELEL
ncbi:diaminopimelate epimerase [Nanoarchaeota archaeon]